MNTPLLSFLERSYRGLLRAYPPSFRQRFGEEMVQVFRTSSHAIYRQEGKFNLTQFWLSTLWDWALTVPREQISSIFGGDAMIETNAFDRQLGDAVWMLMTGLFAGYSLKQTLQALAKETPEPVASAFRQLSSELEAGLPLDEACEKLKKAIPSAHLAEVLQVIQQQQKMGGNLAWMLKPVGEKILEQAGSDPALYQAMRVQAKELGAQVPERAKLES
jgi:hypothetical protein